MTVPCRVPRYSAACVPSGSAAWPAGVETDGRGVPAGCDLVAAGSEAGGRELAGRVPAGCLLAAGSPDDPCPALTMSTVTATTATNTIAMARSGLTRRRGR